MSRVAALVRGRSRRLLLAALVGAILCAVLGPRVLGGGAETARAAGDQETEVRRLRLPFVMAGAGDPVPFIPAVQDYLHAYPKDAAMWASLGNAYREKARRTGDPAFLEKADGALTRSLRERPERNLPALVGQGGVAVARHDFRRARDLAERVKGTDPHHAPLYGVLTDALLNLGDLKGATRAAQRMLDLAPGAASFHRGALVLEHQGRPRDAERAVRRALQSANAAAEVAYGQQRLGDLAWSQGRIDGALKAYEKALAADAQHTPALLGRARAEAALAKGAPGPAMDRALRHYTEAVGRQPEPLALLELAELHLALGHKDQAKAQFAAFHAQERLMSAAGVVDNLAGGLYHSDHGDPATAVRLLAEEWRNRPTPVVADAYGWALHRAGRDREALDHARKADTAGPRSALFAYHRGEIERALGDRAAARRDLTRALRLNPHFSPLGAAAATRALARL